MTQRRLVSFFIAAMTVAVVAWVSARYVLESRLTIGAGRDLETIIDLAAITLANVARADPEPGGTQPAVASDDLAELRRTLERASDRQLRTIYFFDDMARVLRFGDRSNGLETATGPTPAIVGDAIERRQSSGGSKPGLRGTRFAPYAGLSGEQAVGAWRIVPELAIGIVAERPYDRFIRPRQWLDGAFASILVMLVLGTLYVAEAGAARLRALFRWRAVESCGPYVLERTIGEGAMSDVYVARHRHLGRRVAIKRLKAHAHRDELASRFTREARLASQLAHPNIVAIHDYGAIPGGGFWYAMEHIEGLTLTALVERHGAVPAARAVHMLRQVSAAIGHMHGQGLLHRDVKPENIMAYAADGDGDRIKLLDFGLIKDLETDASRDLTRDARVLGTPAFMAPERLVDPRMVDRRSDLYGIGCVGFWLLTARKPFEALTSADLAQQVLHVTAPRVSSLAPFVVPSRLDALLASCLAKDMRSRPPDADSLVALLDDIALDLPWPRDEARQWWSDRVQ